ncbi:hypothetical protein MOQ50_11040 [Stenotrophomonas maltophilia]|nr:hypothetical protein [Stenotrophomonas maltophilia]
MSRPIIRCGLIQQGRSNLKYHAIRADGTAACSSYIPVVHQPFTAASIPLADRCNAPACRKLFANADKDRAEEPVNG